MYLFVNRCGDAFQTKEPPTEQDFVIRQDADGYFFYGYSNESYYEITRTGESLIALRDDTKLLLLEGYNAPLQIGEVTDWDREGIECEASVVFKYDGDRFYKMDTEGDWVKLPIGHMSSCHAGDYHSY